MMVSIIAEYCNVVSDSKNVNETLLLLKKFEHQNVVIDIIILNEYYFTHQELPLQVITPIDQLRGAGFEGKLFVCISCEMPSDIANFLGDGADGLFFKPYIQVIFSKWLMHYQDFKRFLSVL